MTATGVWEGIMGVSFIVPCFNEEENIVPFFSAFSSTFSECKDEWELLFIDDGSRDGTYGEVASLSMAHQNVRVMRFSRNFGKEAAIWAGLKYASGDIIGIIDADLQQPPSDALAMVEIVQAHPEYDMVAAYQERRIESKVIARFKNAFYRVLSKSSGMEIINDASDFRVFRRNVAQAVLETPESSRFSKGIFAWIGFTTYPYPYTPIDRYAGESKWSFVKLLKYALNGLLAFTTAPLKIATILGTISSACSIVYFLIVLLQTLIYGVDVPGYATTLGVVLLLGGIQLLVIGIMGEYLARVYIQGKHRPIYIEKESLRMHND